MKSNRRKFFYNGILLTAVGLSVRSVGMIFNSFITRAVGAEGIGLYTLIMTVYSFAITFATSGISLTVTRLVAAKIGEGKSADVKMLMRHSVLYALVFSCFSAFVLICGAEYFAISVLGDSRCILPLKILGASLVPISLSSVFGGYFVGIKRVAKNATVQVAGQIFKVSITLLLVFKYASRGVEYAIIALALSTSLAEFSSFAVGLFQFLLDRRRARKKEQGRKGEGEFSDVCAMAIPLALSAYIRSALLTLEHILIPKRLRDRGDSLSTSLSAYGILHGMALPLLVYPMAPLSSFSGLLVPEFAESMAKGEDARMRRIASEALNMTLAYATVAAVFMYTFSEELGYVIYDSYGAGHYIAVMAPVIPVMYLDHVADSVLKGIGEHVYSMWVNISDSLLSVILVWVLIPIMGISGYAIVIVCMEGFNFVLSAGRLYKKIRFKIDIPKAFVLPLVAAALASFACKSLFVMNGGEASAFSMIMKLVFSLAIFFAVHIISKRLIRQKNA